MNISNLESWCKKHLEYPDKNPHEKYKNLKLLTIIIPTYERQDFLFRQIVYWNNIGAKIIIVDGSKNPLSENAQLLFKKISWLKYFHLPINLSSRMNFAASQIETPYVALLGDDDFLLKTGLKNAIEVMEEDSQITGCIGQSLSFSSPRNKQYVTYGKGYALFGYHVLFPEIPDRLKYAVGNFNCATSFAVLREPLWSKSWGVMRPWSSPYVAEVYQLIITYIFGKFKTVDSLSLLRSNENEFVSIKGFNRNVSFSHWWSSRKFEEEKNHFIESLSSEIVGKMNISYKKARTVIIETVEFFIASQRKKTPLRAVPKFILKRTKDFISNVLRNTLSKDAFIYLKEKYLIFAKNNTTDNLGPIENLRNCKTTKLFLTQEESFFDLREIDQIITRFNEIRFQKK